jgi:hypothetical protein
VKTADQTESLCLSTALITIIIVILHSEAIQKATICYHDDSFNPMAAQSQA